MGGWNLVYRQDISESTNPVARLFLLGGGGGQNNFFVIFIITCVCYICSISLRPPPPPHGGCRRGKFWILMYPTLQEKTLPSVSFPSKTPVNNCYFSLIIARIHVYKRTNKWTTRLKFAKT